MKDISKSPRLIEIKHDRRKHFLRRVFIFFLLLVLLLGTLGYFSAHNRLIINKIIINGVHIIDQSKVEKLVFDNITGRYHYLFSKANFLIYPRRQIYNNLQENFSRIETLSIYKKGLNTLYIDITERLGSYLYCGNNIPEKLLEVGENCYFVNNDGFIFDKAPYFSGDIYFKYYAPIIDGKIEPLGSQILKAERFHEIIRFIDGVIFLGFNPIYIIIGEDGICSLYLKSNTNLNPKIIFKDENDLVTILDNLSIAMSKKEFADEINSKYNTLEYIDLKFKNKVLYKFQ